MQMKFPVGMLPAFSQPGLFSSPINSYVHPVAVVGVIIANTMLSGRPYKDICWPR